MSDIFERIKQLNLPTGEYMVLGGGALAAHGIRTTRDLDIIVTRRLFKQLSQEWESDAVFFRKWGRPRLVKEDVEIYQDFYYDATNTSVGFVDLIRESRIINGVCFQSLTHLRQCKLETARAKDLRDIELIDNYMKQETNS